MTAEAKNAAVWRQNGFGLVRIICQLVALPVNLPPNIFFVAFILSFYLLNWYICVRNHILFF